jgi:N6-adenosine-specific RNA methylase IME4
MPDGSNLGGIRFERLIEDSGSRFGSTRQYGAVLCDPPWNFRTYSAAGEGRSASQHYDCMDLPALAALPIGDVVAKDSVLFMWTTDPMLPQALTLIGQWGFTFKTVGFYWVKTTRSNSYHTGMGFWTRANPEICLLATRGHPRRLARDVRRLVVSGRREHSRKPDEVRDRIQRLVAGPYLELFARETATGWDSWGLEVGKFDQKESLPNA